MKVQKGFTLLETLIVAAILAGVLAALGTAFVSSYRTWTRQKNEITAMLSANTALRQIARDIATAESVRDASDHGFTLVFRAESATNKLIIYDYLAGKLTRQSDFDDPVTLLDNLKSAVFFYDQYPPVTKHIVIDLSVSIPPDNKFQRFWTSSALRAVKSAARGPQ